MHGSVWEEAPPWYCWVFQKMVMVHVCMCLGLNFSQKCSSVGNVQILNSFFNASLFKIILNALLILIFYLPFNCIMLAYNNKTTILWNIEKNTIIDRHKSRLTELKNKYPILGWEDPHIIKMWLIYKLTQAFNCWMHKNMI